MSTVLDQPFPPAGRKTGDVTREEIAVTERILQLIDRNNLVLASTSQWLLVWQEIRGLSWRIDASSLAAQEEVGEIFGSLLEEAAQMGTKLIAVVSALQIAPETLMFAVGCSQKSLQACVGFLADLKQKHFGEKPAPDLVAAIWREVASESGDLVPAGH